jgi:hypothetical protein
MMKLDLMKKRSIPVLIITNKQVIKLTHQVIIYLFLNLILKTLIQPVHHYLNWYIIFILYVIDDEIRWIKYFDTTSRKVLDKITKYEISKKIHFKKKKNFKL